MLFLLLGFPLMAVAIPPSYIGHGIYLQEIPDLIPFEGTIPLFFHIPTAPANYSLYRTHEGMGCMQHNSTETCKGISLLNPFIDTSFHVLEKLTSTVLRRDVPMFRYVNETVASDLKQLVADFGIYVKKKQQTPVRRTMRFKRSFGSWFWEGIFGVASVSTVRELQEQEEQNFKFMESIRKSVKLGHRELLEIDTELSGLGNSTAGSVHKMASILAILSKKITERINATASSPNHLELYITQMTGILADFLTMIHTHTILSSHLHIQDSCAAKQIPHAFVSPDVLRDSLERAQAKLHQHGRTLAIGLDELELYYKLPLTYCSEEEKETIVRVSIPFIKSDARWKIIRSYPVPYGFGDQTLFLDLPNQLIARNGDDVRIFESLDENKCGGKYELLCLLPIHSAAHIKSRDCLFTLLGTPSVSDVQNACEYTQINSSRPHVTPLPNGYFSIAHVPKSATIQCIDKTKTNLPLSHVPKYGNLQIRLPCHCQLTASGTVLASNRFPCAHDLVEKTEMLTIIPADWTLGTAEFPHPDLNETLRLPNLTEEIMPMVKRLDESAPRYINITAQDLDEADDRAEAESIAHKITTYLSEEFPLGRFYYVDHDYSALRSTGIPHVRLHNACSHRSNCDGCCRGP